jgi:hypothetical protein
MSEQAPLHQFTYHGPHSGVTLRKTPCGKPLEVLFFDGAVVSVPPDHPYVQRLVARGYLTAIETPAVDAAATTPPSTSSRPTKAKASTKETS